MLRITDLSKRYGRINVLHNISLTIPSSGIYVLRGENGSGKTTLLKCLAGLERYQGSILWHSESLLKNIAVAFDDSTLHGRLTGLQNLRALLDASSEVIEETPAVRMFFNNDLLRKRSANYSLGQRKKIKIAAAFAALKPCILLDEPLSGLDKSGREGLLQLLESSADTNCVLISDHESAFYRSVASSEFTIRRGKIHRDPGNEASKIDEFDE
ncbi:ATP-binding cassette domain-containing protein [Paenarthrobacter sp. AR 02]|uniref:ABC transporter ATP-binding protein n=1 Tax=Paenarthrobacter sp. AR 02 TaxID=2899821 RepID=UPI001F40ABB5|nr:ATP-binding cassette domain-containing protein [Paenarthrobacter sp. AR 02]MCF3139127.1 ATP-binding cassette domain-containing protein [Paenarthrobacter sp. AR 02]